MRKTKGQLKTGLAVTCTTVMMASVLAACGGGDPVSDKCEDYTWEYEHRSKADQIQHDVSLLWPAATGNR
jgi:hypothetical protein